MRRYDRTQLLDDLSLVACALIAFGVYSALSIMDVSFWAFCWLLLIPFWIGLRITLWPHIFGRPDGLAPRLICKLRGHDPYQCHEECCGGKWWCARCLAPMKHE